MRFDVISIFPDFVDSVARFGVTGRAVQQERLQLQSWDLRTFTQDRHHSVDDRPYGGGPGMVMQAQPLADAVISVQQAAATAPVLLLSPQGQRLTQAAVQGFAELPRLILIAGRYEGVDERFVDAYVDEEWSIGDYVLSGGELAAMVLIDAVARMLPGVLGDSDSAQQDSFMQGLLDCPHYSRPEIWQGRAVPEVLLSGDHQAIARWRAQQALGRTWERRPDLLTKKYLNEEDRCLLQDYQKARMVKQAVIE